MKASDFLDKCKADSAFNQNYNIEFQIIDELNILGVKDEAKPIQSEDVVMEESNYQDAKSSDQDEWPESYEIGAQTSEVAIPQKVVVDEACQHSQVFAEVKEVKEEPEPGFDVACQYSQQTGDFAL